jgi:hypothetical protein
VCLEIKACQVIVIIIVAVTFGLWFGFGKVQGRLLLLLLPSRPDCVLEWLLDRLLEQTLGRGRHPRPPLLQGANSGLFDNRAFHTGGGMDTESPHTWGVDCLPRLCECRVKKERDSFARSIQYVDV